MLVRNGNAALEMEKRERAESMFWVEQSSGEELCYCQQRPSGAAESSHAMQTVWFKYVSEQRVVINGDTQSEMWEKLNPVVLVPRILSVL